MAFMVIDFVDRFYMFTVFLATFTSPDGRLNTMKAIPDE